MYYSPVIVAALTLASCAASNAGNLTYEPAELFESIECPTNVCNAHDTLYRGTHILQPINTNIENSITKF